MERGSALDPPGTMEAMSEPTWSDLDLRVTHTEREKAAAQLRDAMGDGRLALEEFDARLPAALNAVTRGDLHRVLRDLIPGEGFESLFQSGNGDPTTPGMTWEHPLIHRVSFKGLELIGAWEVPPFMEFVSGGGGLYLNFVEARPLAPVIDIVFTGTIRPYLVVPRGWGVDLRSTTVTPEPVTQVNNGRVTTGTSWGMTVRSRVPTRPEPGQPLLLLRGTFQHGLIAREPNWWDRRRLAKHQRRRAALPAS